MNLEKGHNASLFTPAIEYMKRIVVYHSGLSGIFVFSEGFPTRSARGNDGF
jgi:hypothetical protein